MKGLLADDLHLKANFIFVKKKLNMSSAANLIDSLRVNKCILLTADTYILVTGGDDNAVHVTLITKEKLVAMETDSERSMSITCTGSTLSAHAAQVTGKFE